MAACSSAARRLCLAACVAAAHAIVASTTHKLQTSTIAQRPAALTHQAFFPIQLPCNAVRTRAIIAVEKSGETDVEAKAPEAWYADSPTAAEDNSGSGAGEAAMTPPEPDLTELTFADIENTKWKLLVQPREEGWMQGGEQYHEFTLLSDGSVVWGEKAGGFGVKGRWTLKDDVHCSAVSQVPEIPPARSEARHGCAKRCLHTLSQCTQFCALLCSLTPILCNSPLATLPLRASILCRLLHALSMRRRPQVIRTTPLGILTGRDYYMIPARAEVTKTLQFGVRGVIRSYNAFYPVAVVADFAAVRQKGRFKFDVPDSDSTES
eukprot:468007-Pleurochrysis_carterae.AAC.3